MLNCMYRCYFDTAFSTLEQLSAKGEIDWDAPGHFAFALMDNADPPLMG